MSVAALLATRERWGASLKLTSSLYVRLPSAASARLATLQASWMEGLSACLALILRGMVAMRTTGE
jgi:hypothetical protein